MDPVTVYTKTIHSRYRRYATWFPDETVYVGSYGTLDGRLFQPRGRLDDIGIDPDPVPDARVDSSYGLTSKRGVVVSGGAQVTAGLPIGPAPGATMRINFSAKNSFYFAITNCKGSAVRNLDRLTPALVQKLREGVWDPEYHFVSRLTKAGLATIFVSGSTSGSVTLNASTPAAAPAPTVAGSVQALVTGNFVANFAAKGDLTPLMMLARLEHSLYDRFIGRPPRIVVTRRSHFFDMASLETRMASNTDSGVRLWKTRPDSVVLNVRLPKVGSDVDLSGILAHPLVAESPEFSKNFTSDYMLGRIGKKKLLASGRAFNRIAAESPHISLVGSVSADQMVGLHVALPRQGRKVNMGPISELARRAVAVGLASATNENWSVVEIN